MLTNPTVSPVNTLFDYLMGVVFQLVMKVFGFKTVCVKNVNKVALLVKILLSAQIVKMD